MYEHVVVGVDFSPGGVAVLETLDALKSLGTRRLTLIHVSGIIFPTEGIAHGVDAIVDVSAASRERLTRLGARLRDAGFEVGTENPIGDASESVSARATELGADLILVGSRGKSRVRDAFVGSVAWGIVHRAEVPVMVQRIAPVPGGGEAVAAIPPDGTFTRVIHPTDWSAPADIAFRHVEALAGSGAISTFLLLHVRDEVDQARSGRSTEKEALTRLEELAGRLRSAGANDVQVESPGGSPVAEIVRRMEEGSSLTVMGTTGRGTVREAILGSVSRETLRRAVGPMVLVRR